MMWAANVIVLQIFNAAADSFTKPSSSEDGVAYLSSGQGKSLFDRLLNVIPSHPSHLDDVMLKKPRHTAMTGYPLSSVVSSVRPALPISRVPVSVLQGKSFQSFPYIVTHELAGGGKDVTSIRGQSHSDRSTLVTQAFLFGRGGSGGSTVNLPRDYRDLTNQCQRAIKAAMKDGTKLMEVEFPPVGLQGIPGDGEGGTEMDLSAYHISNIIRGFADSKSVVLFPDRADEARMTKRGIGMKDAGGAPVNDRLRDAPFADRKYRTGYLTTPSGLSDFLINTDKKVSGRCKQDDSMYLVAYPSFNVNEMLAVGELYDDLTNEYGSSPPIITFNGEIDRIRSGYYPGIFYPKLGNLNKEFIPKLEGVYYLRNFKGSRPGVLFRCYPGPWQVLLRNPLTEEVSLVQEFDRMPTLKEVSALLAR
eukprot:gnl/MRDRNA2_/MRDRNA2_131584_c0_seq1.p1 gnl/MRDRNA2_/MRDRNA2_131584_c0~~gnl/MRDRNA2_/MRDRNA2_131584_c0_seq1.p1  ORF type:complete len:418 (-),score=32.21 gnl/MRDRNA2_/MRDRNA2_131584_c0_seq1:47-1300(-)